MLKPQEKQFKNRFNVTESNNFISKKKIANMNVILNRVRLENNKKKNKKTYFYALFVRNFKYYNIFCYILI
jgi:hypothetical protein